MENEIIRSAGNLGGLHLSRSKAKGDDVMGRKSKMNENKGMKSRQVTALIMSGMLAFGTVSPVMAAELQPTEPVTPRQEEVTPQSDPVSNHDISSRLTDEALGNMADNLSALADQVLDAYNAMTEDEKGAIAKVNIGTPLDIPAEIQSVKDQTNLEALKKRIYGKSAEEADELLYYIDDSVIAYLDNLNAVIRQAKDYASNYNQYLQTGITTAIQLLQDLLVKDRLLYADDYLSQVQALYDEAVTLIPGEQTNEYIIDFCDKVNLFYREKANHLNTKLLDEGIRAADAFAAFLACAPDPAIADTVFNYGGSTLLTYGNVAGYVKNSSNTLKAKAASGQLTHKELSDYSTILYGNLMEAYKGVSTAILTSVSEQVKDAEYIGYSGDKKDAYEAALKAYNEAMAAKNYEALAGAVKAQQKAAADYTAAAEDYAKTEGRNQIAELNAIKEDIENHREYYNDTYPAEIADKISELESADFNAMTGRQITDLINKAKTVAEKRGTSYSQKLYDLPSSAASMDKAANEWWGFLPEAMKGQAPYAEAVKLTNDLSNSLSDLSMISAASNTVYDLDKLTAAYDAFTADFTKTDGKIQTAAKAAAQYVHDSADKIYNQEANKTHTAGLLKAFRAAIDELKTSIGAWDYDETRTAAKAVKTAEANLLNDSRESVKTTREAKTAENKAVKAAKTGDDKDAAAAGLLGLLSLSSIAGVLPLKRKK